MLKALAVVRSIFLVFIVAYTVRAMPLFSTVSRTFDEQYARCSAALDLLIRAAWLAVGWIAFETALGWWMAVRSARKATASAPASPTGP